MKNNNRGKILVIVESGAKAKTLSKFLPSNYIVRASIGHVTELPKSKLGFDPDNDFKAEYSIAADKQKIVRELKSIVRSGAKVILASDDDSEGSAIAWHLCNVLKLDPEKTDRIVFHEITKKAILNAIATPGRLDIHTANMALTRRLLDRIIGYKLSPVVWTKIKYGLSVGRVQSACLKIITDKEDTIKAFDPEEYWKLQLNILTNPKFTAGLHKINGKVKRVPNEKEAKLIKDSCDSNPYVLTKVSDKEGLRKPLPPFTTSTLQQEASRKLFMDVKTTMSTAQRLYDGSIKIPNRDGGLITYMRTDSMNLASVAIEDARRLINNEYGKSFVNGFIRTYTDGKNAQAAHEAVRPVDMTIKPSDIKSYVDSREYRLYSLIWARTMATQMSDAKVSTTTYIIHGGSNKEYEFIAKGTKILFPGWMKAYEEGKDEVSNSTEKFLPTVPEGTVFSDTKLTMEQQFTKPPARYTEAGIVQQLEAKGIGRPSTYGPTISTVMARGYVEYNKDKRLQPTVIGCTVSKYLKENFGEIVDLKFTANMEADLDGIAKGEVKSLDLVKPFYDKLMKNIKDKAGGDRVQFSDDKVLGKDPVSGLDVVARTGTYGLMVQLGKYDKNADKKEKKKIASVPKGMSIDDVTLELALHYLELPKTLGQLDGYNVRSAIGRFGPYIHYRNKYYSVKEPDDPYTIDLKRATIIIRETDEAKAKAIWLDFPEENIQVIEGRYGPYICEFHPKLKGKKKKKFFKIPKDKQDEVTIKKMSLKEVKEIMKNQPASRPSFPRKKKG